MGRARIKTFLNAAISLQFCVSLFQTCSAVPRKHPSHRSKQIIHKAAKLELHTSKMFFASHAVSVPKGRIARIYQGLKKWLLFQLLLIFSQCTRQDGMDMIQSLETLAEWRYVYPQWYFVMVRHRMFICRDAMGRPP